jgi:antiviral helicase SKI2
VLSNKTEKESGDFQQGHFIIPKGKHGMEDEYFSSGSSRKGSGVTKSPYRTRGGASGMGFEVRAIEKKRDHQYMHQQNKD